jgi:hypothetical protein
MGDRSDSLAATSAQSRAHPRSQTRRARIAGRGAHTHPCAEPRGPTPSARSSRPSRSTLRVPLSTLGGPTRRYRNRMPPDCAAGLRRSRSIAMQSKARCRGSYRCALDATALARRTRRMDVAAQGARARATRVPAWEPVRCGALGSGAGRRARCAGLGRLSKACFL